MEAWAKVRGNDKYEVSTLGNVRNADSGKILKTTLNTWGYPTVTLCDNGIHKNKAVHRLVAEAFIPNTNGLPEVNHLDENKSNNSVDNLSWVTKKENMNYGTRTKRANEKKFKSVVQYSLLGAIIKIWNSVKDAEEHGFNHSAISACCHGKRKTHGGFAWGWG